MATFLEIKKSTEQESEYGTSKSGSKGTHTLIARAPVYTGRESRVNSVKAVSADDGTKTAVSAITQLGALVHKFTSSGSTTESGTVVFNGGTYSTQITTNSAGIKVDEDSADDCTLVIKYNGAVVEIDEETGIVLLPGDPGASEEVVLDVEITVPMNEDANSVNHEFRFIATSEPSPELTLIITQAQSTPTISLTPLTAQISAAGGSVELTLTTNDDWSATVIES